jgi:Rrf2 family protein
MGSCIKISEGAALGLHACVLLAQHPGDYFTVPQLAGRLQGSSAHLAKVMQRLAKSGIVKGLRGPRGGFFLAKPPSDVFLIHIFSAIEGEQNPVMCAFENPVCGWKHCMFNGLIQSMDQTFLDYLKETSLAAVNLKTGAEGSGIKETTVLQKKIRTSNRNKNQ